jgi:hypothetical protein
LPAVWRTLGVALALTAIAVAGCGGSSSSGVSAASYVKAVCQAVGGWASDIQVKSGALNVTTVSDAAQGKTEIENFFDAAVADTDTVVSKLKSAGVPDVANGKKISDALVSSFSKIGTALRAGQTEARALPTSSPRAFKAAGEVLGNKVRTSLNGIGASLSGLNSPELEKAASKVPACNSVGG